MPPIFWHFFIIFVFTSIGINYAPSYDFRQCVILFSKHYSHPSVNILKINRSVMIVSPGLMLKIQALSPIVNWDMLCTGLCQKCIVGLCVSSSQKLPDANLHYVEMFFSLSKFAYICIIACMINDFAIWTILG